MIKMKMIVAIAAILSVFASCQQDDINVTLDEVLLNHKMAGTFAATITNSESIPYADKAVQLYDEGQLMQEVFTDEFGVADFGEVNVGNYTLRGSGYDENGTIYSFERNVQVVAGLDKNSTIIPSEYSGKVTIEVFESHLLSEGEYSDMVEKFVGTVALFLPQNSNFNDFSSIKNAVVAEKQLSGESNEVSFENLPLGDYLVVYYTDEEHYQVLSEYYYDSQIPYINYVNIYQGCDFTRSFLVRGDNFEDYTGSVSISVYEYFQFGYNSKSNPQSLSSGKVALLTGNVNSYYTFDDLMQKVVVEKELNGSSNVVTFDDLNVGRYTVLVYTDEDHYQIADLDYNRYSQTSVFVSVDEVVEKDAIVNATSIRSISFDQQFYVYEYNYSTNYTQLGVEGAYVYVLKEDVYYDLDYDFRRTKGVIEKMAFVSGRTDVDGLLNLSVNGYEELTVVVFDEFGNRLLSRDFFSYEGSDRMEFSK